MKEEFLGYFAESLLNDPKSVGKPTEKEVEHAALWFIALYESQNLMECGLTMKDWAEMLYEGMQPIKYTNIEEWLEDLTEQWDELVPEDRGPEMLKCLKAQAEEWGWK